MDGSQDTLTLVLRRRRAVDGGAGLVVGRWGSVTLDMRMSWQEPTRGLWSLQMIVWSDSEAGEEGLLSSKSS